MLDQKLKNIYIQEIIGNGILNIIRQKRPKDTVFMMKGKYNLEDSDDI